MENILFYYPESGYMFNNRLKRLEWFEIDKISISFTSGVVRYKGILGGNEVSMILIKNSIYSSEVCFKKGESIPMRAIGIYDIFRSLYFPQ